MMTGGAGVVIWAIMGVMMLGMITGGHQEGPQPHRADRGQGGYPRWCMSGISTRSGATTPGATRTKAVRRHERRSAPRAPPRVTVTSIAKH